MAIEKEQVIEKIKKFLDENEWKYDVPEEGVFTGGLMIDGKLDKLRFFMIVDEDYVKCVHVCDIHADKKSRGAAAEFICRANYGMKRGSFEMDFEDGEVNFKHNVSYEDVEADYEKACSLLLFLGPSMFEQYGEGYLSVIFGIKSPEEAITQCEEFDDEDIDGEEENDDQK